ncbi:tetratricopeptide repeat-containing sensor histidine kinase [Flavobacterium rhizosphaerae]|uniref:tetratricopeptide repeat-containing sensor histidine kinase n=1 Tax=Flavobacterium rhizosphaerae TaxID=3163298 RepID=UPI0038B68CB7
MLEKANMLNELAAAYENAPPLMEQYAKKAIKLAKQEKLLESEAQGWQNLGNANIIQSKYTSALRCFTNAQTIYEQLVTTATKNNQVYYKEGLANIYGSIGIVCSEQNNYGKALEYYFKALKLFQETGQEAVMAIVYNNIGNIYDAEKEYGKALDYFNKALWIHKKSGDLSSAAITISNIGKIYLARDEDSKALQSFNEAEGLFKQDEYQRGLAELYNNFGNYYLKKDDNLRAEKYFNKAITVFEQVGEKYGTASSLYYLGELNASQGNDTKAIANFQKSADYAREIGVPKQVMKSEKALSDLYEKTGNPQQALAHYKNYTAARESINNAENIKSMVREEMNYEFERKAALQKVETEKKQALFNEQAKRYKLQMLFTGLLLLLLFGIAFLVYSRLQLKKTLTLQRDLAEYEQKALHLQMNPHFVFNCLGAISAFIVQNGTDSAIKYLSKFSKLMRLTLEYSKESLIPIDKEIEGLQNYLELEQLRFNKMFTFNISKAADIEDDVALPPLLIQPFVENAIMHGIVPKKQLNDDYEGVITINFLIEEDKLVCIVTDNGIGINRSKQIKENSVTVHKSLALEITRKRLEIIQEYTSKASYVEIDELTNTSGQATGTKITLYLPIQYIDKKK